MRGLDSVQMNFDVKEWSNLLLRWVHVFAGILSGGAPTYYFTWLDGRFTELEKKTWWRPFDA